MPSIWKITKGGKPQGERVAKGLGRREASELLRAMRSKWLREGKDKERSYVKAGFCDELYFEKGELVGGAWVEFHTPPSKPGPGEHLRTGEPA